MLSHRETHLIERIGWLRAAVLRANDCIVSTARLILGVVSASGSSGNALVVGVAGFVAGAMADLERERHELHDQPEYELEELAQIYVTSGLDYSLAR